MGRGAQRNKGLGKMRGGRGAETSEAQIGTIPGKEKKRELAVSAAFLLPPQARYPPPQSVEVGPRSSTPCRGTRLLHTKPRHTHKTFQKE
eukprot:1013746-Rhodomonas_salina.2